MKLLGVKYLHFGIDLVSLIINITHTSLQSECYHFNKLHFQAHWAATATLTHYVLQSLYLLVHVSCVKGKENNEMNMCEAMQRLDLGLCSLFSYV